MKPLETSAQDTPKVAPDDRLGGVVPQLAPTALVNADLGNVIVLARHRRAGDAEAPAVEVNDNLRPVPNLARPYRHAPWTILIAGALLFHLAVVLAFLRAPQPLPEVGLEAISVELEMIGNNQPVGVAVEASEAAEAPKPEIEQKQDLARNEPETPVEPDKPEPPKDEPRPEVAEQPKPEPRQPPQKKASKKAAPAQTAQAGGIGAGQSSAMHNYFSQVAQHLSRHKRFPPQAREAGQRGVATVSFAVDGSGNVGTISLALSSGFASLDEESQAMVKRASPFPAPPNGQSMNFTVPVNFDLR